MLGRFWNLIVGKLESALNSAEDPAIVLDQAIAEMNSQYEKAVQKLGMIRYEKDRLGGLLYQLRTTNNPQSEIVKQQYESVTQHYKQVLESVKYMKSELDKMKRDASTLKASAEAASIHKQVQKITDISSKSSPFGRFISAEERIHSSISAVQVRRDLGGASFQRSGYLPSGALDVDTELAKLEQELVMDSLPSARVSQTTTWQNDLVAPKFPEFPKFPEMQKM